MNCLQNPFQVIFTLPLIDISIKEEGEHRKYRLHLKKQKPNLSSKQVWSKVRNIIFYLVEQQEHYVFSQQSLTAKQATLGYSKNSYPNHIPWINRNKGYQATWKIQILNRQQQRFSADFLLSSDPPVASLCIPDLVILPMVHIIQNSFKSQFGSFTSAQI